MDSALPAPDNRQQRIAELQKLKANCKPEELQKIKTKCEILVRDCIASLLIQLSIKDFKEVEGNLTQLLVYRVNNYFQLKMFSRRIKQGGVLVPHVRQILGGLPKRHPQFPLGITLHDNYGYVLGNLPLLLRYMGAIRVSISA